MVLFGASGVGRAAGWGTADLRAEWAFSLAVRRGLERVPLDRRAALAGFDARAAFFLAAAGLAFAFGRAFALGLAFAFG